MRLQGDHTDEVGCEGKIDEVGCEGKIEPGCEAK